MTNVHSNGTRVDGVGNDEGNDVVCSSKTRPIADEVMRKEHSNTEIH